MTPVDAISTASAGIPRSLPAHSASLRQQSIPCLPVAEFAIPVFTTAACTKEDLSTTSMSHITGAAFTTLVVKVPAATQGAVLYTSAMSLRL